jgi:hypothetical protein
MKKTKIISLVLFMGIILVLNGCYSALSLYSALKPIEVKEELIITPDPNNPFQGTWVAIGHPNIIHVINGMNGEWYIYSGTALKSWTKNAVYTIEKEGNGYITSNHWRISVSKDILTVEETTYERYVKK